MAAVATTSGMVRAPAAAAAGEASLCEAGGPMTCQGLAVLPGPQTQAVELTPVSSGALSPCSTASGGTDQLCSVRLAGGATELEGHLKHIDQQQPQQQQLQHQRHNKQHLQMDVLAGPHLVTSDDCFSPGSQTDSLPATTPTPSSATAPSSLRTSGSSGSAAVFGSSSGGGASSTLGEGSGSHQGLYKIGGDTTSPSSSGPGHQQAQSQQPAAAEVQSAVTGNTGSFSSTCSSMYQPPALMMPGMQHGGLPASQQAAAVTVPRQSSFNSNPSPTAGMGAASGGSFGCADAGGSPTQSAGPLVVQLGVSIDSLTRLFRADAETEFEQPVWMVINLQGKIKGSYTAEKMVEFCRRGTLGGAQLVLGLDRNLPYHARQELSYYRPLSHLVIAVHHGARYCPLTEVAVSNLARQGLAAAQWEPLASPGSAQAAGSPPSSDGAAAEQLASELQQGLELGPAGGASSHNAAALAAGGSRVAAMAAAARLRSVLQRLCCGSGSRMQGGGRPMGRRQTPMWMYINHLGWCRGPFSGGKVIQAHMCGRLPHDTLVVGLEPDVPPALISTDVEFWFRPMKFLIEQVAAGYSYNPVSWQDVAAYSLNQQSGQGAAPQWQPLVYRDTGHPSPFQGGPQPAISSFAGQAAAAGAAASAQLMPAQQGTGQSPEAAAAAVSAAMQQAAAGGSSGAASPSDLARTGSFNAPLSAGLPAAADASPASQALLMHLLQPQQWVQDPNMAAAAHMHAAAMGYAMPAYTMYGYPLPALPFMGMQSPTGTAGGMSAAAAGGGMSPVTSVPAVWDHQQQQQQQAMLQNPAAAMMMTASAMMQMSPGGTAASAGYVHPAAAGLGAPSAQQFWGAQQIVGADYALMQQQQHGAAGSGAAMQNQGLLPGVMPWTMAQASQHMQ